MEDSIKASTCNKQAASAACRLHNTIYRPHRREGALLLPRGAARYTKTLGESDYPFGGFAGMVRSNATAAFIVDCLKTGTTKEAILDAMEKKYDAPRKVMADDVDMVITNLRKIGALDE